MKRATVNHPNSEFASEEGDAANRVRLEEHYLLGSLSAKSNIKFSQVLHPLERIK